MTVDTTELRVYWDEVMLEHEPEPGAFQLESTPLLAYDQPHPDRKERVQNIQQIIKQTLSEYTTWRSIDPVSEEALAQVHDPEYITEFKEFCQQGGGRLTPFTAANEHSYTAARYAAGAAVHVAEDSLSESAIVPYALIRPSGHHAQPSQADGYCFINNIAVATEHLIETGQADRVAIIDWDVHHGNGTQEIFYDRDDVLNISVHSDHRSWGDWHPQSGLSEEVGTGRGEGYNVNIPLPHGAGDESYQYVFNNIVEPIIEAYEPDTILVSAGQDPGLMDPLARNTVTKKGFEMLGRRVREVAAENANGNFGLIQEGGYHVSHLAFATLGVLEGALDITTDVREDPFAWLHGENLSGVVESTQHAGRVAAQYWPLNFDGA